LAEKDKIYDDISKGGKGISGEEHKLFKELLEFEKSQTKALEKHTSNIIEFFPSEINTSTKAKLPVKLAAESSIEKHVQKSDFIVSDDGMFAIKLSKKETEEIHLSLLAEDEEAVMDALLYSPEFNKYFISNIKGEFVVGQYLGFDLNSFRFRAILPQEKIIIIRNETNFIVYSSGRFTNPEIISQTDSLLRIKLNTEKVFSAGVIQSETAKDFVKLTEDKIEIPLILLNGKNFVIMY
jgi:hypothetical protein